MRMIISDAYLEQNGFQPLTIFAKKVLENSHVLENSDQCEENTKKRPMWDWKIGKTKDHVPHKKQKATNIEESCI